jgi:hypothetical protein
MRDWQENAPLGPAMIRRPREGPHIPANILIGAA